VLDETNAIFDEAKSKYPEVFGAGECIELRATTVADIVEVLAGYSITKTSIDVKGGTYESFLSSALPVGKVVGQFFTPRQIVDFAVEIVDPQPSEDICDPAMGTAGFLTATIDRVARKLKTGIAVSDFRRELDSYISLHVYGVDIDPLMVKAARMNVLVHWPLTTRPTKLAQFQNENGLVFSDNLPSLRVNSMGVCLTNPPFGSKESDYAVLRKFVLGREKKSRASPILFLERCVQLLKPGGRLAIVVPDPILNGASTRDVREFVRSTCVVTAVVKLPPETFIPYGSSAESSLLILKKKSDREEQGDVFMAEAKYVGYNKLGETIERNDLNTIRELWREFQSGHAVHSESPLMFVLEGRQLLDRLDVRRYVHPEYDRVMSILETSRFPLRRLRDVASPSKRTINPSKEAPDFLFHYIGLGNVRPYTGQIMFAKELEMANGRSKMFKESTIGREIKGSCQKVSAGEILFGKLRPYLRKVVVLPEQIQNAVCSSEFMVLRPNSKVDPEYLAYVLRSDLAIQQLGHLYSGLGRPRVSPKEILDLRLPMPPTIEKQREVSTVVRKNLDNALRKERTGTNLIHESQTEIERTFGELFLGFMGISQGRPRAQPV
jgi:type I restriction enzyme M protein